MATDQKPSRARPQYRYRRGGGVMTIEMALAFGAGIVAGVVCGAVIGALWLDYQIWKVWEDR